MPSFAERLRMQSLYGGGRNPFSPREESPLPLLDQMIRRLPRQEEQPVIQTIAQNLEPERQKQISVQQAISPYQQALLEQRQRELQTREKIAEGGVESREKIAGEREETRRSDLDIKQQRADAYDFKARNPNSKFIIDRVSGNMTAVNPITGAPVRDFGKTQLGQEELINLNAQKATELETHKQTGRETIADINARHRRELEEFKASQPSKTSETPTQKSKQVELNYNILINRKPELRPFVKRDSTTGEITVSKPGEKKGSIFGFGGEAPTKEQIDEINNFLFGSEAKKEETSEERLARLKKAAGVK